MDTDRRKSPRFAFIAGGELHEEKSNTLLRTRVSENQQDWLLSGHDESAAQWNGRSSLSIAGRAASYSRPRQKLFTQSRHLGAGVHFEEIDSVRRTDSGTLASRSGEANSSPQLVFSLQPQIQITSIPPPPQTNCFPSTKYVIGDEYTLAPH